MKKSIILLTILLLTLNIYSQNSNKGYIEEEGQFNYNKEQYDINNISGVEVEFNIKKYKKENIKILTVKINNNGIIISSDFRITYSEASNDGSKEVFLLGVNYYEEVIGLKYTKDKFTLMYSFDDAYMVSFKDQGIWRNYHKGRFLQNN